MSESSRFCPGCGTPRTRVREDLERTSQTTGIPYEELLERARAEELQNPAATPLPPSERTQTQASRGSIFVAIGAAVGVIIGSLGPWATLGFISVSGTSGDGQITIVLGIAAAALAIWQYQSGRYTRGRRVALLIVFGLAAVVAGYDWLNIANVIEESESSLFTPSIGWGLHVAALSSIVGTIAAVSLFRGGFRIA